jgi:hypothetical protein
MVYWRHRQLRQAEVVGQHTHFADFLVVTGVTAGSAADPFGCRAEKLTFLTSAAYKTRAWMFEHHQRQNIPA